MNGDPCQAFVDNLDQLEADAQSLRDSLNDASSPEKQALLTQIKAADEQIMSARNALEECRKAHPAPRVSPPLTSIFAGTIDILSAKPLLQELPIQNIGFSLVFDGPSVIMSAFNEVMFKTKLGVPLTVSMSTAQWEWGTFDVITGLTIVPVTFEFDSDFGSFWLAFNSPLMTTEQVAPPIAGYSPTGMRLNFQTGSITLVGVAQSTDSENRPQDYIQLVLSGTVFPVPVRHPGPQRRTMIVKIDPKAR